MAQHNLSEKELEITYKVLRSITGEYVFRQISNDTIAVSTPWLDNINDNINVYITWYSSEKIILSDDGYTVDNLYNDKLIEGLQDEHTWSNVIGFNQVKLVDGYEMRCECTSETLAKNFRYFLQAIFRVEGLHFLDNYWLKKFNLEVNK